MKPRFAVMGKPIDHSLSPLIHQYFAEQTGIALVYDKILIDVDQFEQQVRTFFDEGGRGLNITLPCKQKAFSMAYQTTSRSAQAKAANTLWMKSGKLHADNTDGIGLLRDIQRHVTIAGKTILLLGAGGAARGVLGTLLRANPKALTLVNRTFKTAKQLQSEFSKANVCAWDDLTTHAQQQTYDLVINATSASLDGDPLNLPLALLASKPFCYDLAYRKAGPTPFVAWAKDRGCEAMDGLGMLVEQAAEAFFIWHGVMPRTSELLSSDRLLGKKSIHGC